MPTWRHSQLHRGFSADRAALASAEPQMAYTGEIRGPVIVVDNIGDPVDSEAYKEAYRGRSGARATSASCGRRGSRRQDTGIRPCSSGSRGSSS